MELLPLQEAISLQTDNIGAVEKHKFRKSGMKRSHVCSWTLVALFFPRRKEGQTINHYDVISCHSFIMLINLSSLTNEILY
jgi:hypothetical protein